MGATAMANTVVLNNNADTFSVGGEFDAVTSGGQFLKNYSPLAIDGDGFETFCLETTVEFTPGTTYTYDVSSVDSLGRSLTLGAALLYADFAKGDLPGYNYTSPTIRQEDAGELQAALWWLQGGQSYGGFPGMSTNIFYEYATTTLGSLNEETASDGQYGVDILQMWGSNGQAAQNQLVMVGVPDQAQTWLMLGMGLAGLAVASHGLREKQVPAIVTCQDRIG